ncbi:inhibitor of DNA binding 4-like protein [Saccoglossus kowalevskii]|uniref:Inhibitor of DNA binding 4-like protein n=1 Tax=Saccoglossus kowalevskii TaxID=10224 RepID=D1LX47_SACKO|nr:inhibitor of DNA binding 4-like protein [Saccoglossus kowalevskii]ACY92553.1 inhibitor of DNA binding 4-like protein [Saccoglossus kowalevskii]
MKERQGNRATKLHNSTSALRHVSKESVETCSRGNMVAAAAAVLAAGSMSEYLDGILTYSMSDCYSKLKDLVPTIPPNKKVSKVELLQHVIDYIQDLQVELEAHPAMRNTPPPPLEKQIPTNRTPLGTIPPENTAIAADQVSHLEKSASCSWDIDSCSPRSC